MPEPTPEVFMVSLAEIVIPSEGRPVGDVAGLAESIRTIGLMNPPTVARLPDGRFGLVAGRHRIAAMKLLGLTQAMVILLPLDALRAELATIDENLIRRELTALERAEQLARRKVLYETIHPEAKAGAAQANGMNRSLGRDVVARNATTFANDTAAKTGASARTVRQDVQIGRDLSDEAKAILRNTPVADRKSDLRDIARLPAEQQPAAALAKVNPTTPAEPKDVAKARRDGIIPEGAKVTIDDPEDDGTGDASAEASEPTPLTDEEWLTTLPARAHLSAVPLRRFDQAALLFRKLTPLRLAYRNACRPFVNAARSESHHIDRYMQVHNGYLATRDPSEWIACNGCNTGPDGLSTGQIPLVGDCGKCKGHGWHI